MVWDFAEVNILAETAGSFDSAARAVIRVVERLNATAPGFADQADAATASSEVAVVSTDPPYYDNISYADLSDFFYVWLRYSLKATFPKLFATVSVPKTEELVATAYRHGSKAQAETFFLNGMTRAMERLAEQAQPDYPITIYYAFKQSETSGEGGVSSTGWETFLDAVIRAGFALTGTWPMRTELSNRMIGSGTNALASSIVLVCRPRDSNAKVVTRREFINQLKSEPPEALILLQRGNIAPVDLAQASIGPGMAVYTRYSKVIDAEGKTLSVREALKLINQSLDEVLSEQEGDFDADTRWALAWFEQYGFAEGEYGVADTLSKAKNTSVAGLAEVGIVSSRAGRVRLLPPIELPQKWDPSQAKITVWEIVHHLIRALETGGESAAAQVFQELGLRGATARELPYRLYAICERTKRTKEAISYNGLVQSWPEISRLSSEILGNAFTQAQLF